MLRSPALGDAWNAIFRRRSRSGASRECFSEVRPVMHAMKSTPAAKISELCASAIAVRYPPYDPPHEPIFLRRHSVALQKAPGGRNVLVLRSAAPAAVGRFAEVPAIHDPGR